MTTQDAMTGTMTNEQVAQQVTEAATELCEAAQLSPGSLLVVGCSSSEIMGETIGECPTPRIGEVVYKALAAVADHYQIVLAAQCCEHLNRALVIEESTFRARSGLVQVNARPVPTAGGSFATAAYEGFTRPVVVETIQAEAGLDIGNTLIGMHLRRVATPVRLHHRTIGKAALVAARTRPPYIGGSRAQYDDSLAHTRMCPPRH